MARSVLHSGAMRTVVALVFVALSASAASAGTFVGLGIGTSVAPSGDFDLDSQGGRSGRLELGYKFGRLSVDGLVSRADIGRGTQYTNDPTWTSFGLAGKYNIPLGDNFEAFGRLGYQHSSLDASNDVRFGNQSMSGSGLFGGGGFEYRLNALVTGISIYVDYTIAHSSLTTSDPQYAGQSFGLTTRVWTLGATLSL